MTAHFAPHWQVKLSCSNRSCNERNRIRHGRLFTTFVNGPHGRTHKEPAFACKRCGHVNVIKAAVLPRGMFETLLDRKGNMQQFARILAHRNVRGTGDNWVTGPAARAALTETLIRTDHEGSFCALAMRAGHLVEVPVDFRGLSTRCVLDQLDRQGAQILVSVHLDKAGRQKAVAFHETFGYAAL